MFKKIKKKVVSLADAMTDFGCRFVSSVSGRGGYTGVIVGIIIALFVAGAMLPSSLIDISNSTAYTGVDSNVVTIATTVLPMIAVIAIALLFLRRR